MYIPTIGDSGEFVFEAPLDSLNSTKILTVTSIRTFSDLESNKLSVLDLVYVLNGLDLAAYQLGLSKKVLVVTLVDSAGLQLHIPSDFITTTPNKAGIAYRELLITASLGLLPVNVNTANIEAAIISAIYDTMGITTTTVLTPASGEVFVCDADHKTFETSRTNKATLDKSMSTINRESRMTIERQANLILELEAELKRLTP